MSDLDNVRDWVQDIQGLYVLSLQLFCNSKTILELKVYFDKCKCLGSGAEEPAFLKIEVQFTHSEIVRSYVVHSISFYDYRSRYRASLSPKKLLMPLPR